MQIECALPPREVWNCFYRAAAVCLGSIVALVLGLQTGIADASDNGSQHSPFAERIGFFRFLEDYSDITESDRERDWFAAIKKIPLGSDGFYLSFGGQYRYRNEAIDDALFGLTPSSDFDLHLNRFLLHVDAHLGENARTFVQFSAFTEGGRPFGPAPFDESSPDIQQAFLDIGSTDAFFRLGRQEIVLGSGLLTDVREGPNQRQSFDAARVSVGINGTTRLDAFYAKDVLARPGAFADTSRRGTDFWGSYVSNIAGAWQGSSFDVYYFGIDRPTGIYDAGAAREQRHSVGARLLGSDGPFSYEYEGIYQFGSFGTLDIQAWGIRTEHHYTFSNLPLQPKLGLIANATSGDTDAGDGTLGTFDALFPNPSYTTDAGVLRPRNIYELHPVLRLQVLDDLKLLLGTNFLWRVQNTDAVYAAPGFPLVPGPGSNGRFVGAFFDGVLTWQPSPHLTLQASYVHAFAGNVVANAGGRDVDFLMVQSILKF